MFSPLWRVRCPNAIPSPIGLEGILSMWQKRTFWSLSLEMPFKAGELDENHRGISLSGEQKTLESSETSVQEKVLGRSDQRGGKESWRAWCHTS